MQYTTMRDREGQVLVAPHIAGGLFVSDDDPTDAPAPMAAEPTPTPAAPADEPPPPRRPRSTLDRQLRGDLPAPPANWQTLAGYGVTLLLVGLALWALLARVPAPEPSAEPADAPTTAAAALPATAAPGTVPLPLAAVAYDSPDGAAIDALEPGRPCQLVQRPSPDWVQLDCQPGGLVWVRAEKLAGLEDQLPPLPAPTATPEPLPPAPAAPAYQAPAYVPPAPAPVECGTAYDVYTAPDGTEVRRALGQVCGTAAERLATQQALLQAAP